MRRIAACTGAIFVLASLLITPVAARTTGSHSGAGMFTAGLVTDVGGLNDKSFNHLAYLGLQEAEAHRGVTGNVIQSTAQSSYVPNLTYFAARHMGITIGVGFLMENAIYQVATAYPGSKFALVDGAPADAKGNTVNLKNVANLFFRENESGYLVGFIAGMMEKEHLGAARHNVIGYMGGLSIPPVNRYIAGYIAGAKRADPGIHILGGYSQSFTNQGTGREIGLAQISRGADILFQVAGASGLGYLAAAQQRAKYGIGVDADQGYLGKYVITSALKKVDVAVRLTILQTKSHHFRGGNHEFSLKNNATGFAPVSSYVPASIVAAAKSIEKQIKSGKIVPPANISK